METIEKPHTDTSTLSTLFERQKMLSLELRSTPLSHRKNNLRRLKNWLLTHQADLEDAVHADFRKPKVEVLATELFPIIAELNLALQELGNWTRPLRVDAPLTYLGTRSHVRFEPKGCCLIIAPWNYPFNLCIGPLISCLAAGNTAILKPSEMTPHTAAFIAKMVNEVFDPAEVSVVEGGPDVSTALLKLPFDHIFFTGSPAIGKVVMRAAADTLASVTLELGGKSPAIVDETANLVDAAKRIAFGKFFNNGQTCIAPDYVLVHKAKQADLLKALKTSVAQLFGNGNSVSVNSPDYARIVNRKHFDRLGALLQDALEHGAQLELGGTADSSSNFLPPTIITDVAPDSRIMEEEIFGPILPIVTFSNVDEAIRLVNSKPKPLSLYIFTTSKNHRERIITQTSAGAVAVNDCVIHFAHHHLPFGGVNNSGLGKAHGKWGFLAFSNEKPVMRQKSGYTNAYSFYPPYTGIKRKLVNWVIRWFS